MHEAHSPVGRDPPATRQFGMTIDEDGRVSSIAPATTPDVILYAARRTTPSGTWLVSV